MNTRTLSLLGLILLTQTVMPEEQQLYAQMVTDHKKLNDAKNVVFDELKPLIELSDLLRNAHELDSRHAGLLYLRSLTTLVNTMDNIPLLTTALKDLVPWKTSFGFSPWDIKGLKGGDYTYLSEQEVPEVYSVVKKHASGLDMPCPLVFIGKSKDMANDSAANLFSAFGVLILEEGILKGKPFGRKFSNDAFEGLVIDQLARIKNYNKSTRFLITFLKSNIMLLGGNVAIAYLMQQMTDQISTTHSASEEQTPKTLEIFYKKYEELKKSSHGKYVTFIEKQLRYLPNIAYTMTWGALQIELEHNADNVAAYSPEAIDKLIAYLETISYFGQFNMELWEKTYQDINNSSLSLFHKIPYKVAYSVSKFKALTTVRLFNNSECTEKRIKRLQSKKTQFLAT